MIGMLIIVDYRIHKQALLELEKKGSVVLFRSEKIQGPLEGHADVCMFHNSFETVLAPDAPEYIQQELRNHGIAFCTGTKLSGSSHPCTATYNAAGSQGLLIHNTQFTEPKILSLYQSAQTVHVKQGYSRCSTLILNHKAIITSDKGIASSLQRKKKKVLLVKSKNITLPGLPYGLFGGCCGIFRDTVFFAGSLSFLEEGEKINDFIIQEGFHIIELQPTILQDVGGIFIFEAH